jgi:hypothetical protein
MKAGDISEKFFVVSRKVSEYGSNSPTKGPTSCRSCAQATIFRATGSHGFSAKALPLWGVPRNMMALEGSRMYSVYSLLCVMRVCRRRCTMSACCTTARLLFDVRLKQKILTRLIRRPPREWPIHNIGLFWFQMSTVVQEPWRTFHCASPYISVEPLTSHRGGHLHGPRFCLHPYRPANSHYNHM